MPISLTIPLTGNKKTVKDAIISILASEWPLSAKKIYHRVRKMKRVSYQAVHKALKELTDESILEKTNKNYRISLSWIKSMEDFLNKLEVSYEIDGSSNHKTGDLKIELKYTKYKFRSTPISFIPFYLGKVNRDALRRLKIKKVNKERVVFCYNNNTYHWFNTGVCVLVYRGKQKNLNVVDFLLDRRLHHLSILNGESPLFKDVNDIFSKVNKKHLIKNNIKYVMTIYHIEHNKFIEPEIMRNILRICAQPGILGITDNPLTDISKEFLSSIKSALDIEKAIKREDVYEIPIDGEKTVFATWSNVVLYCDSQSKDRFLNMLVELEIELQHLWFLFYTTKMKIKNNLIKGKDMRNHLINCINLWENFKSIDPLLDSQYYAFKDCLIKTSKIANLFKDLEDTFKLWELRKGD